MESLNLNNLASSLPNSNLAHAEKDLMNNFKAAALSLTTLYRSSRRTSKRAYNAGYAAACHDLLLMIQQGVSAGESTADPNGTGGMSIGRVMDYVEARLEAIKSREDEEDEDEERERKEKEKSTVPPAQLPAVNTVGRSSSDPSVPAKPTHKTKILAPLTPPTPSSFIHPHNALPFVPSSPTPSTSSLVSPLHTPATTSVLTTSTSRATKAAKLSASAHNKDALTPRGFPSSGSPLSDPVHMESMSINTGTKRRHTAMLIDSASTSDASPSASNGPIRRRTRSARGALATISGGAFLGAVDQNASSRSAEAMDVEEEGRERKRVARRL